MLQWVKDNPQWVAIFAFSLVECFLGRTKKTRSNSIIELIWNILLRRKP
jgi:hypothetical protein